MKTLILTLVLAFGLLPSRNIQADTLYDCSSAPWICGGEGTRTYASAYNTEGCSTYGDLCQGLPTFPGWGWPSGSYYECTGLVVDNLGYSRQLEWWSLYFNGHPVGYFCSVL